MESSYSVENLLFHELFNLHFLFSPSYRVWLNIAINSNVAPSTKSKYHVTIKSHDMQRAGIAKVQYSPKGVSHFMTTGVECRIQVYTPQVISSHGKVRKMHHKQGLVRRYK